MTIKLGIMLGYSGKQISLPMDLIKQAESLGYDSVWTAEAYGSDAISPAAWILAQTETIKVGTCIMQMVGRTPATCAMTAMTMSQLSGGRFLCGLGASGPQVVEGWHGVPYGKPITRTKEYIRIMKEIMRREGPVEFDGEMYTLPNMGAGTTGLGKPLKSILAATDDIPIYTASITPAGLRCAGEVADGVFPLFMSPDTFSVIGDDLQKGFDAAGNGKSLETFDVAPTLQVMLHDDLDECRNLARPFLALYIGGMGAKGKNFYNSYVTRMGYGDAAEQVQDLYLSGEKQKAEAAIPDALIDEVMLFGPEARIRERAQDWIAAGKRNEVTTLMASVNDPKVVELLADIFL